MAFARIVKKIVRYAGYDLIKLNEGKKNSEFLEFMDIYNFCQSYSMTSLERMFSLYKSVEYILKNQIPGDFVECGVWRGGSAMVIALSLIHHNVTDRKIYLYDTFDGMSEPTGRDIDRDGKAAQEYLHTVRKMGADDGKWCYASLDDVKENMKKTGYPVDNIQYIQGMVEKTIPYSMPEGDIALLRLDTDWYESTLHELTNLYPKLVAGGVLIIDDYGHWLGAKMAVDEYFAANKPILLNRIDYTARVGVKV